MTAFREGQKRLRRCAKLLRARHKTDQKQPAELRYDQGTFMHTCKTPACAFGTYAFNTPERYIIGRDREIRMRVEPKVDIEYRDAMRLEFGLDPNQVSMLFGGYGCDQAQTALEAAEYIENFVAEREANA